MLLAAAVRGAADAAGSAVKLNSSFGLCPLQWSPFTPSPAASFSSSTDVSRGAAWCSPGTHTWAPGGGHTGLDGFSAITVCMPVLFPVQRCLKKKKNPIQPPELFQAAVSTEEVPDLLRQTQESIRSPAPGAACSRGAHVLLRLCVENVFKASRVAEGGSHIGGQ